MNLIFSGLVKAVGVVAVLIGALIGMGLWDRWGDQNVEKQLETLRLGETEFLKIVKNRYPTSTSGKAKARVVFITMRTNDNLLSTGTRYSSQVDPLTLQLPLSLKAKDPEEVGTVCALYWGQKGFGNYSNGDSAWQETCKVRVFDRESGNLIAEKSFLGGIPPTTIRTVSGKSFQSKIFGARCDKKIIAFIAELAG